MALPPQVACKALTSLPALSSTEFRFDDPHTLYDFSAVLQLIEAKDAWQGRTHCGGWQLEVLWNVELGNTCVQLVDGSSTKRLRAV